MRVVIRTVSISAACNTGTRTSPMNLQLNIENSLIGFDLSCSIFIERGFLLVGENT